MSCHQNNQYCDVHIHVVQTYSGFPLGLENGKAFSSQGILNRLEKSGKITQNTGKMRKFQINII